MVDTNDKSLLAVCLSKRLLDKEVAEEVYRRAQREGRSAATVLVDMGVLAQHTVDALSHEMEQALAPMAIAGFRIIRKLGQGGMGAVYLAEQISLHRQVALKVIAPQFAADVQAVDRFMREARMAAAINHPNIISVIDVGYDNGHLYMALELVSGGDAAQLAARFKGVLPEARALEIISDCCRGLGALYEARLIHRDIKPANIFITKEGVAKLADLGLARSEQGDDRLTVSGNTIGTPAFMSPEQASGKSGLDSRSDIYSLGAALFALTTGSPPFTGEGIFAVAAKLLTEPAPDPRSLNPMISAATARVIACCLAKQPAERFQTPHELLIALAEALVVVGTSTNTHPATPPVARMTRDHAGKAHSTPATVPPRKQRLIPSKRSSAKISWPLIGGVIAVVVGAAALGRFWISRPSEIRHPTPAPSTSAQVGVDLPVHSTAAATVEPTPQPVIQGLIAYWPMDEGVGHQVRDLSSNKTTDAISNAT
ncbi:MAG TPA: serine/threonine-protein kinase [Planctomycetota bacterium]|nr:serine/threonine-protein kinase [Planctomycetota bacterium]